MKSDSIVVGPSLAEVDAALLLALNETLRELRVEEENDVARAPTLRTGRAIKRARLDVYARIGIICHPVIARLVTDKGDTINA